MQEDTRCSWCGTDPLYVEYHDTEWGVPEGDSRALFEKLILDGFQAGLAWITILRKRDGFRSAFNSFDPYKIAEYTETDIERLVNDARIVRHRGKIEATIGNARAWAEIETKEGFDQFLWKYVDGVPLQNNFNRMSEIPAKTPLSEQMSKDLRKVGFRFVGPTIVYAFSQACGLFNDHLVTCPRHDAVARMKP